MDAAIVLKSRRHGPFLLYLLTKYVSLEISGSKKHFLKLNYPKTLRICVQRVKDARRNIVIHMLILVSKSRRSSSRMKSNDHEEGKTWLWRFMYCYSREILVVHLVYCLDFHFVGECLIS
ncbi:hypothetical protein P3S67_014614 [Capsicum chacoense]